MNGIHDMGGMHGFGPVRVEENELLFDAAWEGHVRGMFALILGAGLTNIDAFRHAIERMDPTSYLTVGYYGRWLVALETLLVEAGVLRPGELDDRLRASSAKRGGGSPVVLESVRKPAPDRGPFDVFRPVEARPRFAVGQRVAARNLHPPGHTRLPRYVRGKQGVITRVHPACVFPDTHAHGRGEQPQYVYSVRFVAQDLWGVDGEPAASVNLDLFESYLESA